MKYNLHINQYAIVKNNFRLSSDEALILNVISYAFMSNKFHKYSQNGINYTWISYNHIIKELPILGKYDKSGKFNPLSKSMMYRKVTNLVKLGFLNKLEDSEKLGRTYFAPTNKFDKLFALDNKDIPRADMQTPRADMQTPPCISADPPRADMHNYNNTNNNNTNNNKDILSTSKEVNAEPLLKNTDINHKEYLEIFDFFVTTTNKKIRLHKTKSLIERSDRYKKFISTKKKGYTVEDMKAVIKVKNEEWKDDIKMKKHINISTLFGAKFEKYLEQAENPPVLPLNNPTHTNTPIQQIKLTGLDLDRFKHLSNQLNDTRFTESTFLNVFGCKKYDAVRNRKTPREIVRVIQAGLNSLSQAFNKNRSLTELIIEKL